MKKNIHLFPIVIALILAFAMIDFILGLLIQNKQDKTFRIAGKNESVSLLAFREYKNYNAFLDQVLRHYNQHLADFNNIASGDTVFFPNMTKMEMETQIFRKPDFSTSTTLGVPQKKSGEAVLTFADGLVTVKSPVESAWVPINSNLILGSGTKIRTDDGWAEILFANKSLVRIGPASEFEIEHFQFHQKGRVTTTCRLERGKLWLNMPDVPSKNGFFELRFPNSTMRVNGANFQAIVAEDKSMAIHVYSGTVLAQMSLGSSIDGAKQKGNTAIPAAWEKSIAANQSIHISATGRLIASEIAVEMDATERWMRWNSRRDSLIFSK
ncbi:MAG: hypothetical protein DWQ05_02575 [Calditrichaeota bacterium]|nr:MAG: hypothetical protein DWQ05_02575 [Calditrichota bacterium]